MVGNAGGPVQLGPRGMIWVTGFHWPVAESSPSVIHGTECRPVTSEDDHPIRHRTEYGRRTDVEGVGEEVREGWQQRFGEVLVEKQPHRSGRGNG